MANIASFPLSFTIVGDGASLTAAVAVDPTPTSVTLGQVQDIHGNDVSANIASAILAGSTVTFTFNAAFSGAISVALSLAYPSTSSIISVSNFPATQPVSGTFFQGTQPVSIATMPSTPVTGTFWQATQPVSVATMPTTPVTGTFWQATQPVSLASQKVGIVGNTGATVDAAAAGAAAPTNAVLVSAEYNSTPLVLTAGQAAAQQCDTAGASYTNSEGRKATYSACAIFSPGAAGDVAVLPGSATKTIRVLRVEFSCSTSGTAQIQTIQLIKRSTADTGGTSAAVVAVPHDSLFPAASAAPKSYTAAPTLGTLVGPVRAERGNDPTSISSGGNLTVWTFGTEPGGSALALRGVAEQLCINMQGVPSVQSVTASFTWTEE